MRKKYLYGIKGEISEIFPNDSAEIRFDVDGKQDYALLKKGRFYHNGKLVPESVQLSKYVRNNMKVEFSCHVLDRKETAGIEVRYKMQYDWYVIMCWVTNENSPNNKVTISMGLFSVPTAITSVTKRHGVLTILDPKYNEDRISFLASKVYLHGKRFSSSKALDSQFNIDDKLLCDAVPCIAEENRDNCRWLAICAFHGKRPRLAQPIDMFNDFQANYLVQPSQKFNEQILNDEDNEPQDRKLNQYGQQTQNLKSQLLKVINLHTSNPRTLFTTGYGYVLDVLNDDFAIMLGCFKRNVYETILFHRKNAFLFNVSLARAKLSEIFVEGDRMRFIAVGAPPKFVTDWIAVQVAVAEWTPENENPFDA